VREYLADGLLLPSDPAKWGEGGEWTSISEVLANLPPPVEVAPPPPVVAPPPAEVVTALKVAPVNSPLTAAILVSPKPAVDLIPTPEVPPTRVAVLPPLEIITAPKPALDATPIPISKSIAPPLREKEPAKIETLAPVLKLNPADQKRTSTEQNRLRRIREREITPPPDVVVPYNQPMPFPTTIIGNHWRLWGRHVLITVVFVLLIWVGLQPQMAEASMLRLWNDLNFMLNQGLDEITSFFTALSGP